MDQELVNFYRNRWQAVERIEQEEQRNSTILARWEKLNGLMRMARSLHLTEGLEDPMDAGWLRWSKLKQMVH
ncbi:MAG TPA: hypothetical protein PK530_09400 [Anaerolineales bacterium]|jgi:hypothetical protein|nr:hypothetical protein [Anaerolineales bacterium]